MCCPCCAPVSERVLPDQALERMSDKALPEWAPFAATLAQRLAKLVGSGHLGPDQALWTLAVDQFLLRAVDTEGQACFKCPLSLTFMRVPAPSECDGYGPHRTIRHQQLSYLCELPGRCCTSGLEGAILTT